MAGLAAWLSSIVQLFDCWNGGMVNLLGGYVQWFDGSIVKMAAWLP